MGVPVSGSIDAPFHAPTGTSALNSIDLDTGELADTSSSSPLSSRIDAASTLGQADGSDSPLSQTPSTHYFLHPPPSLGRPCRLPDVQLIRQVWNAKKSGQNYQNIFNEMPSSLARPFNKASGRGFTNTSFKIDDFYSSIMMKQEDVWVPFLGPGNTVSLRTLYEIGHSLVHSDSICRHCRWDQEYPWLVSQMADFPIERVSQDVEPIVSFSLPIVAMKGETEPLVQEASRISERLRCALFHGTRCFCPASTHWGAVKSCPRCHTDYAVSILLAPSQPEARCFVFTTWKYLGNGTGDLYWKSHVDPTGMSLRFYPPGSMYSGYEPSKTVFTTSSTTFIGQISRRYSAALLRAEDISN